VSISRDTRAVLCYGNLHHPLNFLDSQRSKLFAQREKTGEEAIVAAA